MARPRKPLRTQEYFESVRKLFEIEARNLTAFIPQSLERGRNDEERVRKFLRYVLPRRFSIGNGFIVCSDETMESSPHIDIIIFDEFYNSPLIRQYLTNIHPIETIYAIIEVKYTLKKREIRKIVKDIEKVRNLSKFKYYVKYKAKEMKSGKKVVEIQEIRSELPPRAYVFTYDSVGFKNINSLVESLREEVCEKAHIHGLIVLDKGWFISQRPFKEQPEFDTHTDDALLRFVNGMIKGVASIPMKDIAIDRYLNTDKFSGATYWNPEEEIGI